MKLYCQLLTKSHIDLLLKLVERVKDQCEILSEADNIVSNNHLTLKDLDVKPSDVEEAMKKWLWRYKDGGQFAKA